MRTLLCFLFAIGFIGIASAQTDDDSNIEIISHRVLLGETVRLISVKYLVTPADIYRLNRFAVDGIREGMLLQIPLEKSKAGRKETASENGHRSHSRKASRTVKADLTIKSELSEHIVESGETLSEISKNYGVSITEIKNANHQLDTRGLRAGETILVPSKD